MSLKNLMLLREAGVEPNLRTQRVFAMPDLLRSPKKLDLNESSCHEVSTLEHAHEPPWSMNEAQIQVTIDHDVAQSVPPCSWVCGAGISCQEEVLQRAKGEGKGEAACEGEHVVQGDRGPLCDAKCDLCCQGSVVDRLC